MDNVYRRVALFYRNHESCDAVDQDLVERYLRKMAWRQVPDAKLKNIWQVIAIVLSYLDEMTLLSFDSLTVHDYQELVWEYHDAQVAGSTSEEEVQRFFAILRGFFVFLEKESGDSFLAGLDEAKTTFYKNDKFVLPERQAYDEFYTILEHLDEIDADTAEKLNLLLENLLNRVGDYFRRSTFSRDLSRAISLYAGPFVEGPEDEKEEFWFSFWDYFFFDYHLIENDLTPLRYFYEHEQKKLQPSELYILRDLLKARFTAFSIDSVSDEFITCTDLFSGEPMELPCPDYGFPNFKKTILFGHLHLRGVMMLNYITAVPATARLRKRIKEEILRQYDLYKTYQEPQASLQDFFLRHAAAVRHTINILSAFAQLKVVPMKKMVGAVTERASYEAPAQAVELLETNARTLGYSVHSIRMAKRLYDDFSSRRTLRQTKQNYSMVVAAVLLLIASINGIEFVRPEAVVDTLKVKEESVLKMVKRIQEELGCAALDPRYLTEEGFVQALYIV